jgi:hypothetical protein
MAGPFEWAGSCSPSNALRRAPPEARFGRWLPRGSKPPPLLGYKHMANAFKSPSRIEALLLLYFLALLVHALIELQLRRKMAAESLADLPLYPEERACERPTADRVLRLFGDVRCHRLLSPSDTLCRTFRDQLTQSQAAILQMLGMSPSHYFADIQRPPSNSRKA